jgi:hypothetical protein
MGRVCKEIPTVQNPARKGDERGFLIIEFEQAAVVLSGRSGPEVAQSNAATPFDQEEVLVVPQVQVHPAEHAASGAHKTPLDGLDPDPPAGTEEFGEAAPLVLVDHQSPQHRSFGKRACTQPPRQEFRGILPHRRMSKVSEDK